MDLSGSPQLDLGCLDSNLYLVSAKYEVHNNMTYCYGLHCYIYNWLAMNTVNVIVNITILIMISRVPLAICQSPLI